jgi:A/G-specific adenine glycosylase
VRHPRHSRVATPSPAAPPAPPRAAAAIAARLAAWFSRHRRNLPWRHDRDPYRVWVSETMLQQTTVKVVVPYFERFMGRFPTIAHLARAPIEEVLRTWSGLGYYRRARHLHDAAREVVERHGGRVPADREALLALPGIGRYTAGAVLSIAYGRREPVVDGNVTRVLARLAGERRDPRSGAAARFILEEAGRLVAASKRPGDHNEALMELGATVCTPAAPACRRCPLAAGCAARASGVQEHIPPPRRKRAAEDVHRTMALVRRGRRLLVRRRAATGLLDGLWELPAVEPDGRGGHRLEDGPPVDLLGTAGTIRHSITWRRLTVRVVRARLLGRAPRGGHRWVTPAEARRLPASSLLMKALRAAARAPVARANACTDV